MKDVISLLNKIIKQAVKDGMLPVTVQTAVMESETEAKLDQTLTVEPTLPKIYSEGVEYEVEGELNGESVSGKLKLTATLKEGDKVKIIKEDGVNKYYLTDQLES